MNMRFSMFIVLQSSGGSAGFWRIPTVCAFNPSCCRINVSTSTPILFLSWSNNNPRKLDVSGFQANSAPANSLRPKTFNVNYTFRTRTE